MSLWGGRSPEFGGVSISQYISDNGTFLGNGAYGSVFKVKKDGKNYAVKVINSDNAEFMKEDVMKELLIFKALQGAPNVSQLRQVYFHEDKAYLFMDYQRSDLTKALDLPHFDPLTHMESIEEDLLNGLGALHSQGIVHNDIKPPNILVGGDSHLYYSDFGLATIVNCRGDSTKAATGTTVFLAPEALESGTTSKASDVYALGVTLACCYAKRTHPQRNAIAMLAHINKMSEDTIRDKIRRQDYSSYRPITAAKLLEFFQADTDRFAPAESRSFRQLRARLNSLDFTFLDSMLTNDPDMRPILSQKYSRPLPPAVHSFMRCFTGSDYKVGVKYLADTISSVARRISPSKYGIPDATSLALTMDLAFRLAQRCPANLTLQEYLLLCFFITEKAHYSRIYTLQNYLELDPYTPAFDPVQAEVDLLALVDFNIFSCQGDFIRSKFASMTVRHAGGLIAQDSNALYATVTPAPFRSTQTSVIPSPFRSTRPARVARDASPPRATRAVSPLRATRAVSPLRATRAVSPPRATRAVSPLRATRAVAPPRATRAVSPPRVARGAESGTRRNPDGTIMTLQQQRENARRRLADVSDEDEGFRGRIISWFGF